MYNYKSIGFMSMRNALFLIVGSISSDIPCDGMNITSIRLEENYNIL